MDGLKIPHVKGQFLRVVWPIENHWEFLFWCMQKRDHLILINVAATGIIALSITVCIEKGLSVLDNSTECDAAFCQNSLNICSWLF